MDTIYLLLKYLHILAAIVWVGGMVALTVLNTRLAAAGDPAVRAALGRQSEWFGRNAIGPAMAIVLLAGLAAAGRIGFPFSSLWIAWGLAGFVLSIAIGVVAVGRTAAQLGEVARGAGMADPRVAALGRRIGVLSWINLLILASVVYAMVFKPTL
jgi:uncharacterized membrane protein